jgi:rod shape-determining protein MreC
MQRFYDFLGHHRAQVVLAGAVLLSLVLMSLDAASQIRFARSVAFGMISAGHRVFAWPMDLSSLRYENKVLREQNLRLSLELLKLREARLENERLHDLLRFRSQQAVAKAYQPARVIARNPARVANTILIDAGALDGIVARMPVVTADGLVGRVLEVYDQTAVVQLLLDRNCRVSAVVQRQSRTRGIVTFDSGTFYLKNVPVRGDIEIGDLLVSSGLGEVFPKGLYVGQVIEVGNEEQGLFREVVLAPGVNFHNLEEVFVLKTDFSK